MLTRPGGRKRILVSTFVVRMQRLHFCLCVAGRECLWMIKLNETIISVLVYMLNLRDDTIKASLYF